MSWREGVNKPVAKPAAPKPKFETKDDDWETDTSYENTVTEKTQRYGSTSIPGSGRVDHFDLGTIHDKVKTADVSVTSVYRDKNPTRGYGGKYGNEQVMDKNAVDFSYKAEVKKHSSQTDAKKGFGGEHGIDERAKDKSAVGFDYKPTSEKHSSQTDASKGFGGKYGVQKEEASPPAAPVVARAPSPKPAPEPKVVEKTVTPSSTKADVGNIRARFENIRKQKEEEAAQSVAEQRKKRAAIDEQLQQQNASSTAVIKKPEKPKPQTAPPVSVPRPETPPQVPAADVDVDSTVPSNSNESNDTNVEEKKEEAEKIVGGINVSALLRQRKTSSSSSKNEEDDAEWAAE